MSKNVKRLIFSAGLATGAAVMLYIQDRNIQKRQAHLFALIKEPLVTPEVQAWVDYVKRYPNLTDDPKIAAAVKLLNDDLPD